MLLNFAALQQLYTHEVNRDTGRSLPNCLESDSKIGLVVVGSEPS
jgi:hypothetical protein